MKRAHFYILLSLAERDRHGLDIMRDVLELTEGELKLWPATLYGSLDELVAEGWIETLEDVPGESERKRFYRVTSSGRHEVSQETRKIESLVETARLRLREAR